jgi:hypothetical protein
MRWPEKLERVTEKIGGRFLDYDLQNGTWSFSVQHFSKYELPESDEEIDENEEIEKLKKQKIVPKLPMPKIIGRVRAMTWEMSTCSIYSSVLKMLTRKMEKSFFL